MHVIFIEIYDGEEQILDKHNISYKYSPMFWKIGVTCGTEEYANRVKTLLGRR